MPKFFSILVCELQGNQLGCKLSSEFKIKPQSLGKAYGLV